jgi:uncharacterized repeat protein (TIGR02543 family)
MKKRILPAFLFALVCMLPQAQAAGETETLTTTWSNKVLSNKYIEWNLGNEWNSISAPMTWRKSTGHEVTFHARASDGKGNTIFFNLETAALVRTYYYGGDNYLWHSVDHNSTNSAHEESDTLDFVAEEAFLTADGHQALVVHTRTITINPFSLSELQTDNFTFYIDGSTVGFPQPDDTWMKAKVRIHTTTLSDSMSLDEAKTIVNGLKFMGGTPQPAIRDSPEYANMTPSSSTVISANDGKPVVVQVGDTYNWHDNLDGVTLWSVENDGGEWTSMTMRFENGRNFGNLEFHDQISLPQPHDMPFVIDENGYVKVTEDGNYQYYNVVSVENGVIGTLQDESLATVADNGVNQVDQWFFTTRAAAEEYLADKTGGQTSSPAPNYAPDSLIGQVITHTTESTVETLRFMDAHTVLFYESAQDANPGQQQYTYAKTSGTTAQVTVIFEDGGKETTDYVFTGADTANYVWKELSGDMDTASGTAAFADAIEGEWLAYDDFSDGTLDTTKWGTMYMDGAAEPTITGGQVKFSSGVGNLSAPSKIKSGWESIFTADDGGQSYLYLNETEIYGIEAEVSLPSTLAKSTGFNVGIASKTPLSATAAELNNDNFTTAELAFWNLAADGAESRITDTGSLGMKYRLAAVHADGKNTLYLDGEKQVEYPATNLVRELTYIGSFNDFSGGQPYTIYADNVKVLWKVEAPEESIGDSSAPAAATATITAATSSSSQGSVTGGGTFTVGATASLTATATAGYLFSHWSGGYSGTENPLSLTVSADATVTANFAQDGRDSDNDGLSNYDEIQRGTDPNDSDTDDDFLTDGLEVEMALNPAVANGSLQEIATAAQAALTNAREAGRQEVLNNPIAYGFVSGGAPVTNATGNGETPMIEGWFYQEASGWQYVSAQTYPYLYRASPSSWLYFQPGSSNPPLLYDFSEERWLTPPTSTHMVKVNANLTEAGSVSGGGTYEEGSSVTLTATPANGYVFVAWSGDVSGESASTTIIVDGTKTVTAIFSKITAADVKEVLDDIFGGF